MSILNILVKFAPGDLAKKPHQHAVTEQAGFAIHTAVTVPTEDRMLFLHNGKDDLGRSTNRQVGLAVLSCYNRADLSFMLGHKVSFQLAARSLRMHTSCPQARPGKPHRSFRH
ncbi:hypothetical protein ABH922_005265 [Rhodococcus sp. 27YEA15]